MIAATSHVLRYGSACANKYSPENEVQRAGREMQDRVGSILFRARRKAKKYKYLTNNNNYDAPNAGFSLDLLSKGTGRLIHQRLSHTISI